MPCGEYRGKYMTQEGHAALCTEIDSLLEQLRNKRAHSADKAARSTGSTSFGVRAPDGVSDEHDMLRGRITELTFQKNEVTVIKPPTVREYVRIDTVVTLTYAVQESATGRVSRVRRRYHIVGHGEGDCSQPIPRIAYDCPLAAPFLGKEKGFKTIVMIDKKKRTVEVTAVYLPTDAFVRRINNRELQKAA